MLILDPKLHKILNLKTSRINDYINGKNLKEFKFLLDTYHGMIPINATKKPKLVQKIITLKGKVIIDSDISNFATKYPS